jgi:hypothetical protein
MLWFCVVFAKTSREKIGNFDSKYVEPSYSEKIIIILVFNQSALLQKNW